MGQKDNLKAIADAIRTKEGTTEPIVANTFAERILAIPTGTDTSDANATAAQILKDKTAYVKGNKITGTIVSMAGTTVTPAYGYSNKVIETKNKYLTGNISVVSSPNLVSYNIKQGVNIFGVNGTYDNSPSTMAVNFQNRSSIQMRIIYSAYWNASTGTQSIYVDVASGSESGYLTLLNNSVIAIAIPSSSYSSPSLPVYVSGDELTKTNIFITPTFVPRMEALCFSFAPADAGKTVTYSFSTR